MLKNLKDFYDFNYIAYFSAQKNIKYSIYEVSLSKRLDYDVLFISNPHPKMQTWTHFGWDFFLIEIISIGYAEEWIFVSMKCCMFN